MAAVSARLTRSQPSCTASSASLSEPSMRYATARRWRRCSSKRATSQSVPSAAVPVLSAVTLLVLVTLCRPRSVIAALTDRSVTV